MRSEQIKTGVERTPNRSLLYALGYTDEELEEATFGFDKFYVQSVHYDDLVKENETLRKNLDAEIAWRTRDD